MGLVAEFQIDCEALPLTDVAAAIPEATLTLEIQFNHGDRPPFLVTIQDGSQPTIETALSDAFDVGAWTLVGLAGETHRYQVRPALSFEEQLGDHLNDLDGLEALATADAIIERIEVLPSGWRQTGWFANRDTFGEFSSFWQRNADFQLFRLPHDDEGSSLVNKGLLTLEHLNDTPGEWYFFLASYFTSSQLERLYRHPRERRAQARAFCRDEFDAYTDLDADAEKAMAYEVERYLPDDLLFKVDVASMMNSLECRSPFLDHRFAETVARFPIEYKLGRGEQGKKRLLREAFRDRLPEEVLEHRKMGFGIPRDEWLRDELSDYLPEVLFAGGSGLWELLDRDYVEELMREHQSGNRNFGAQLWSLLMLRLWMDQFDVRID